MHCAKIYTIYTYLHIRTYILITRFLLIIHVIIADADNETSSCYSTAWCICSPKGIDNGI